MQRNTLKTAIVLGFSAILAGCAQTPLGPTVQVMPGGGKSFEAFQIDNSGCKQFAAQQVAGQADQANQRAVTMGLLTTAVGAASGAALGGGSGAAFGAGLGSTLGTGVAADANAGAQFSIQQQYDAAFSQCMYAKGNNVPGYAPVTATASYSVVVDPLVRSVQHELIRIGGMNGGADGVMGIHTRSAISEFESANGMAVDGSVSPQLLARLRATPTPSGSSSAWVAPVNTTVPSESLSSGSSNWVQPVSTH